jgi:hypothetical protein
MNTRKDNNGKALKAWRALGPGHIAKPLRHIANRTNSRGPKGEIILSDAYKLALGAHKRGLGDMVQNMARAIR